MDLKYNEFQENENFDKNSNLNKFAYSNKNNKKLKNIKVAKDPINEDDHENISIELAVFSSEDNDLVSNISFDSVLSNPSSNDDSSFILEYKKKKLQKRYFGYPINSTEKLFK